ncbi:MAG: hypothetical protein ACJATO_000140, partial [Arenicella sp.]
MRKIKYSAVVMGLMVLGTTNVRADFHEGFDIPGIISDVDKLVKDVPKLITTVDKLVTTVDKLADDVPKLITTVADITTTLDSLPTEVPSVTDVFDALDAASIDIGDTLDFGCKQDVTGAKNLAEGIFLGGQFVNLNKEAIASLAPLSGSSASSIGIAGQIVALTSKFVSFGLSVHQQSLPSCSATFQGDITVKSETRSTSSGGNTATEGNIFVERGDVTAGDIVSAEGNELVLGV